MRIRFLIQGFDEQKLQKNTAEKSIFFKKIGIYSYLSEGHHKGRPRYRRSLQPSKENIQHLKT
jgi:hypothetical protein